LPDAIKFVKGKQPPLNTDDIIGRKFPIEDKALPERSGEGLPLRFDLMGPEDREVLLHPKPMTLVTEVG